MNAAGRLTAYAAGLAVILAAGWFVGDRSDLGDVEPVAESHGHSGQSSEHDEMTHDEMTGNAETVPAGLQVSQDGYSLALADTDRAPGSQQVRFRIVGPDGRPVTEFEESHEKLLHLIVVRRDFSGFQHVHPVLDEKTGTWRVDVDLAPGTWRVFADFVPGGMSADEGLTLGTDLRVSGNAGKQLLPQPVRRSTIDGFTVTAEGQLVAGEHSMLELQVTRHGKPVTDLQPYLGAYGHLVALREGDLAYLHVHPGGEPGDGVTEPGPTIEFGAEVPSDGRYHLFLDFKVAGVVHTAAFTLDTATTSAGGHDDHDH
ncbi:hypothetical protein ASG90_19000 [Nocardioides sp. Soil797]|nr:hypothetical protein ASG90_19000 [Nocardioides sp. Soil797]